MAKARFQSIDEYIASQPPATQKALRRVRAAIRKALPRAQETISYNSLRTKCPAGLRSESYELVKGTIRFPLDEPVPQRLIERIAAFRGKEIAKKR